jgi:hypothetical protein
MIIRNTPIRTKGPVRISTDSAMRPRPHCGDPDWLTLDSNSAAEASWIECGLCDYRFQRRCDEETLTERWNKLKRAVQP